MPNRHRGRGIRVPISEAKKEKIRLTSDLKKNAEITERVKKWIKSFSIIK